MPRGLWARVRGRAGGGTYAPRWVVWHPLDVAGQDVVDMSRNYHEATLGWIMGVGLYRQIRVDLNTHKMQLVSIDRGTVVNRAQGHRAEPVYRVSMRLAVGDLGHLTSPTLMDVLSSDFDRIAEKAQRATVGQVVQQTSRLLDEEVRRAIRGGSISLDDAERFINNAICGAPLAGTRGEVRCQLLRSQLPRVAGASGNENHWEDHWWRHPRTNEVKRWTDEEIGMS